METRGINKTNPKKKKKKKKKKEKKRGIVKTKEGGGCKQTFRL